MTEEFWIFGEQTPVGLAVVTLELLAKGLELKAAAGGTCRLCVVLFGEHVSEGVLEQIRRCGADVAYVVEDPELACPDPEVYAATLSALAVAHRPEVLLAGATSFGRAFFARVAVALQTGLTADCTSLRVENGLLLQTRPAFGGNVLATIVTERHRPQMATVRPGVFRRADVAVAADGGDFRVVRETISVPVSRTRLLDVVSRPRVDISKAKVLVAGGRGMGSAVNFDKLRELARRLGGEVAGSRAAVEAGWLSRERQVGQTGRTVAPDLYLCFGISGAIQHLVGMRGAARVIAVNKDAGAAIFGIADYGIVGDAVEVVDSLLEELPS